MRRMLEIALGLIIGLVAYIYFGGGLVLSCLLHIGCIQVTQFRTHARTDSDGKYVHDNQMTSGRQSPQQLTHDGPRRHRLCQKM